MQDESRKYQTTGTIPGMMSPTQAGTLVTNKINGCSLFCALKVFGESREDTVAHLPAKMVRDFIRMKFIYESLQPFCWGTDFFGSLIL